jgi:hypothetical protein
MARAEAAHRFASGVRGDFDGESRAVTCRTHSLPIKKETPADRPLQAPFLTLRQDGPIEQ